MKQLNYAAMSDRELKRYILTHRDDLEAFHAYMDRRNARSQRTAVEPDDPNWEEKLVALIREQLGENR